MVVVRRLEQFVVLVDPRGAQEQHVLEEVHHRRRLHHFLGPSLPTHTRVGLWSGVSGDDFSVTTLSRDSTGVRTCLDHHFRSLRRWCRGVVPTRPEDLGYGWCQGDWWSTRLTQVLPSADKFGSPRVRTQDYNPGPKTTTEEKARCHSGCIETSVYQ